MLELIDEGSKALKSIAVTSGKGGSGKSCITAYTGLALAAMGHNVLLMELGSDPRSLDLILGAQDKILFDMGDVVFGTCHADKAVVRCAAHRKLYLLPAPPLPRPGLVPLSQLQELLSNFEKDFAFILLDGADPVILSSGVINDIIAVTTPDSLCVRATSAHVDALWRSGVGSVRLIINNVPPQVLPIQGAEDFDDIIDIVGAQLLGVVPTSPKLQYSSNNAAPVSSRSITVQVFESLAGRLLGEDRPLLIS